MAAAADPERNARILELWARNRSMAEIGRAVGCSRSAVGGVIQRAEATRSPKPAKGPRAMATAPTVEAPPATAVPTEREHRRGDQVAEVSDVRPAPPALVEPPPPSRFACLGDALLASDAGCRWPMEDAGRHWFCGAPRHARSYCAAHAAAATGKGTSFERRAAAFPLPA